MKKRDLSIVAMIYLLAYAVSLIPTCLVRGTILQAFVFDLTATVVTFLFSLLLHNSSVYDPYWSLTPMVISLWLFFRLGVPSFWQLLFLLCFNLWGLRLTVNWCIVFTDFSYEDWRYRMYRDNNPPVLWFLLNFFGIHLMPTLLVFAGMLPLFPMAELPMGALSLLGDTVLLCGVALEFFADRQMHAFLTGKHGKTTCRLGLWGHSRHPNYLGEITVWCGVFLAMLPYAPHLWYYGVGALSVAILFNAVSIPMMERRQLSRRSDYADYQKTTSRLLLKP